MITAFTRELRLLVERSVVEFGARLVVRRFRGIWMPLGRKAVRSCMIIGAQRRQTAMRVAKRAADTSEMSVVLESCILP